MVINHLDKLFVTNDAATILRELEVRNTLPVLLQNHEVFEKCCNWVLFFYLFSGKL